MLNLDLIHGNSNHVYNDHGNIDSTARFERT